MRPGLRGPVLDRKEHVALLAYSIAVVVTAMTSLTENCSHTLPNILLMAAAGIAIAYIVCSTVFLRQETEDLLTSKGRVIYRACAAVGLVLAAMAYTSDSCAAATGDGAFAFVQKLACGAERQFKAVLTAVLVLLSASLLYFSTTRR